MEKIIVNVTLEMPMDWVTGFEGYLNEQFNVINYKIVPNTKELYDNDKYFRKLVKDVKKITKIKDEYINLKNHETSD